MSRQAAFNKTVEGTTCVSCRLPIRFTPVGQRQTCVNCDKDNAHIGNRLAKLIKGIIRSY